jgi:hypothetical protein
MSKHRQVGFYRQKKGGESKNDAINTSIDLSRDGWRFSLLRADGERPARSGRPA